MSDIQKIREIEEEHRGLIEQEKEKAKERISNAESDASFRIGQAMKEQKEIIGEIVTKGTVDAANEVAYLKEEKKEEIEKLLKEEENRIRKAVDYIMHALME
jgi:tRNA uridine 5-carbamoylmethylation protein Kti12